MRILFLLVFYFNHFLASNLNPRAPTAIIRLVSLVYNLSRDYNHISFRKLFAYLGSNIVIRHTKNHIHIVRILYDHRVLKDINRECCNSSCMGNTWIKDQLSLNGNAVDNIFVDVYRGNFFLFPCHLPASAFINNGKSCWTSIVIDLRFSKSIIAVVFQVFQVKVAVFPIAVSYSKLQRLPITIGATASITHKHEPTMCKRVIPPMRTAGIVVMAKRYI